MGQKRILFVSHDANRAGSQLLLLQLLRLLKERGIPMHLLLCNGGELEPSFQEVVTITRFNHDHSNGTKSNQISEKIFKKVGFFKNNEERINSKENERVASELAAANIGLVFVNSIANAEVYHESLTYLHHLPLVLFVHELAMSVKIYTTENHLTFLLRKTDHLIAVSHIVANYYVKKYDFPMSHVSTFTLIDHQHIDQNIDKVQKGLLEKTYRIPNDAIVIGGCGNAEWRKGNDIFNWVARNVIHKTSPLPVYFVWVGAGPEHEIYELIESDIRLMGLSERIILIPPTSLALHYINRFDALFLSSREDPYPLVVLEAALQQIPVVCFKDAGGAPELIESDAGYVVPFLDIEAASDALIQLVLDPARRRNLGHTARKKVLSRHNTDNSVEKIETIIQKFLPIKVSERYNQ